MNDRWQVTREFPVSQWPGRKYSFLFALADPTFPDDSSIPRADDAGKLMALAAYGDEAMASSDVIATVDRILELPDPVPKADFRDSPVYNAGLESDVHTNAAALLTRRVVPSY